MDADVERFNSPYSRRVLLALGTWLGVSAAYGLWTSRDIPDSIARPFPLV